MKNITLTILNLIIWATFSLAQSPSVTASEELYLDNEVEIFFTVRDFTNIEGFQFSIIWNPDHLSFVSRSSEHPSLSFWLNTPETQPGEMRVTWVDFFTGAILNLADDEVLFSLNFTVEDAGQVIPIRIEDQPLASIATINGASVQLSATDGLAFPVNLPVEFKNFEASYQEQKRSVKLEWATAAEVNSSHFEVQKSSNGINFETITSINSRGNELQGDQYLYEDERPYYKQSYYRIKQVDFNGTTQYSEIQTVFVKELEVDFSISPNPAQNYLTVSYPSNELENVEIAVYNAEGRLVLQEYFGGGDWLKMDVSGLTSGVYIVVLSDSSTRKRFSGKLVKE